MSIGTAAAPTVAMLASFYFRHAPWLAGKRVAYELFSRHVGRSRRVVTTRTVFGDTMEVEFPDFLSRIIYLTGQWEPMITRYLRSALKPGDTFVDVGANLGYYTLLASKLVSDSGRVVAIEASPSIAARLQRNVDINQRRNIRVVAAAAAAATGELPLFDGKAINRGHTTTVESVARKERLSAAGMVRADTLERLAGSDTLRTARLIKVDVEGAELAVLKGTFGIIESLDAEWLLELTPRFCPGGQADVDAIFEAFTKARYRAYAIPNGYTADFIVNPSGEPGPLTRAPKAQCDVLMTKDRLGAESRLARG